MTTEIKWTDLAQQVETAQGFANREQETRYIWRKPDGLLWSGPESQLPGDTDWTISIEPNEIPDNPSTKGEDNATTHE